MLGIDTSLRSTGIGVVNSSGGRLVAVNYGTIRNPQSRPHSACLDFLYQGVLELVEKEKPDCAAVEGIFFCKNVRTAVILGQARGAVLAACAHCGLQVYEYSPRLVKQAVVGSGAAHKSQVGKMIMALLGLPAVPSPDAADALAIAVCHIHGAAHPEMMRAKPI